MDFASTMTKAEWSARCDLARLYRLAAIHGMSDLIYNHISLRLPDEEDMILLNPFGMLFKDVTASSLVKVDADGNIVSPQGGPEVRVNKAGINIHWAVHRARPEMSCVLHSHTAAGMAVSAQAHGLLPITQHAMMFYGLVGYHDYESFATQQDERQRIAQDFADNEVMILRNHGVLVAGRSVGEAFHTAYHLEKACEAQIMALSGGTPIHVPPQDVAQLTADRMAGIPPEHYDFFWQSCLTMLPDLGEDCCR